MGKRNVTADNDIQHDTPHKKAKYNEVAAADLSDATLQEFVLTKELVQGTILTDLCQKDWRVGKPIGKHLINLIK